MTRAAAYLAGRDFVAPQDVTAVFDAVARHRLVLNDQARAGGETVDSVMQDLLRTVPRPRPEKADRMQVSWAGRWCFWCCWLRRSSPRHRWRCSC